MTSSVTIIEKSQVAALAPAKEPVQAELQGRTVTTNVDSAATKVQEVAKEATKDQAPASEKPKEIVLVAKKEEKPQEVVAAKPETPAVKKSSDESATALTTLILENVKDLSKLTPNLISLTITEPQDAAAIGRLKECKSLQSLSVIVKDEAALMALKELTALTTLNVRWSAETKVENFPKFESLASLTINGPLCDKALKAIAQSTKITELSINPESKALQKFTNGGLRDLLKALPAIAALSLSVKSDDFSKSADRAFSFGFLHLIKDDNLPIKTITYNVQYLDGKILGPWCSLTKYLKNIEHIKIATANEKSSPKTKAEIEAGISCGVTFFMANKKELPNLRQFTLINPQNECENSEPFPVEKLNLHIEKAQVFFEAKKKQLWVVPRMLRNSLIHTMGFPSPEDCDVDLDNISTLIQHAKDNMSAFTHVLETYSRK